jgi:hypothetical protein
MKRALWFLVRTLKLVILWLFCLIGEFFVLGLAFAAGIFVADQGYPRIATLSEALGLIAGNAVLVGPILYYRHRTRHKWVEAEAERRLAHRARSSDVGRRCDRLVRKLPLVQRSLLWAPSACAMFVLVFFPAATQIRYGHRVGNFTIPLPWSWTILQEYRDGVQSYWMEALMSREGFGRFGVNTFWSVNPSFSEVWFVTAPDGTFGPDRRRRERERAGIAEISKREVVLRDLTLTCWEFLRSHPSYPPLSGNWEIECESPEFTRYLDFRAGFVGRQADISEFYRVLQQVRTID